jgi:hypothetical protein
VPEPAEASLMGQIEEPFAEEVTKVTAVHP